MSAAPSIQLVLLRPAVILIDSNSVLFNAHTHSNSIYGTMHPMGRFRGGFVIAGYSILTTSPPWDTTDPMKRIDCLWTNFIPSTSFLLRPCDIADALPSGICSRGCLFTRKMTINGLPLTPQSICRSPTVVSWFLPDQMGIAPTFHCNAIIY